MGNGQRCHAYENNVMSTTPDDGEKDVGEDDAREEREENLPPAALQVNARDAEDIGLSVDDDDDSDAVDALLLMMMMAQMWANIIKEKPKRGQLASFATLSSLRACFMCIIPADESIDILHSGMSRV